MDSIKTDRKFGDSGVWHSTTVPSRNQSRDVVLCVVIIHLKFALEIHERYRSRTQMFSSLIYFFPDKESLSLHDRRTNDGHKVKTSAADIWVLTGEAGALPSCFLEELGLLGAPGLPWPFLIFWPIADNQSCSLGEQFSLPVCLDEASTLSSAWQSVCGRLPWAGQQTPDRPRLLLAAGWSSVTQPHCSAPSQPADAPSPVSSLRLARRSVGEGPLAGLWGNGLSTLRPRGLTWPGEPRLGEDNHCWIEDGDLRRTAAAVVSCEGTGEVVLEGRGNAAPLGAQAASWGDAKPPRLSVLWILAGVVSALIEGP